MTAGNVTAIFNSLQTSKSVNYTFMLLIWQVLQNCCLIIVVFESLKFMIITMQVLNTFYFFIVSMDKRNLGKSQNQLPVISHHFKVWWCQAVTSLWHHQIVIFIKVVSDASGCYTVAQINLKGLAFMYFKQVQYLF